jgi:hypothetical protein
MNVWIFIPIVLNLLTGGTNGSAQDCRKTLDQYFKSINIPEPEEGKVYYMDMKIKTVMYDSLSYPDNRSSLKITVTKDRYYYKSEQLDFYKDKKHVFLVMHNTKMIVWADAATVPDEAFGWNTAFALRDSLVNESEVTGCTEVAARGTVPRMKKIVLEPPSKRQKQTRIQRMEFYLNPNRSVIQRSVVHYNRQSAVCRAETVFNEMTLDAQIHMPKTVKELVLDKNNKPAGAYKGYELVDNR